MFQHLSCSVQALAKILTVRNQDEFSKLNKDQYKILTSRRSSLLYALFQSLKDRAVAVLGCLLPSLGTQTTAHQTLENILKPASYFQKTDYMFYCEAKKGNN